MIREQQESNRTRDNVNHCKNYSDVVQKERKNQLVKLNFFSSFYFE